MTKKLNLLILEDNPNHTELYCAQIGKKYDLTFARTYDEGVRLLAQQHFGVVLIDVVLNGDEKDGVDFFEYMKSNQKTLNIPTIAVTAIGVPSVRNYLLEMGFKDYIEKPYSTDRLMKSIEKHSRVNHD